MFALLMLIARVPEPTSFLLLAGGIASLIAFTRKKK